MLRLTVFLFLLALVSGFKLGQDTPYQRAYTPFTARLGSYPQGVAYTQRERYAAYLETVKPLAGNVLITNPNANTDPFLTNAATVVAVGAGVTTVKEGDLVYVPGAAGAVACNGLYLNKANGQPLNTVSCQARAGAGVDDRWCQRRGCSAWYADKCQWATNANVPAGFAQTAPYCMTTPAGLLGKMGVSNYGANRQLAGTSRIVKPRWAAMSVRNEPLNRDYPNGM